MEDEKTVMLREIALQPDFVKSSIDSMLALMREVLSSRDPGTLEHGFMIGCGDSYCAALAARQYMMKATGRFVEPVEALEFSRYLVDDLPPTILRVRRLQFRNCFAHDRRRAACARKGRLDFRGHGQRRQQARADGRNAHSRQRAAEHQGAAGRQARRSRRAASPTRRACSACSSPRSLSASGIGTSRRGASRSDSSPNLHATAAAMARRRRVTVARSREEIAAHFHRATGKTVILGGGPNYATAYFGMAKWFEGADPPRAISPQLEEWAHEQYFMTDEKTDTFIILPPGAGRDRGLEQARAARDMGSRVIIIGESGDAAAESRCGRLFRDARRRARSSDAVRLQAAVRISRLRDRRASRTSPSSASTTSAARRSTSARSSTRPQAVGKKVAA